MKHDTQITPVICIQTPDPIADYLLRPRLSLLKERAPRLRVIFNPKIIPIQQATIFVGPKALAHPNSTSRFIGYLSSEKDQSKTAIECQLIPNAVGRFYPELIENTDRDVSDNNEIWLSVDPNLHHLPGLRQTLDWVESCVTTLAWLYDANQTQPTLSKALALR